MANKVLTIKMDEKDIEKLKSYHAALAKAGVISTEDYKFNALCKHLLLDYLDEDAKSAVEAYNTTGLCFGKEAFDSGTAVFANTYDLSENSFSILKKCYMEKVERRDKEVIDALEDLERISGVEMIHMSGVINQVLIPPDDENDIFPSYWTEKILEKTEKMDEDFSRKVKETFIEMITQSALPEKEKESLIKEIHEKYDQRKAQYRRIKR